jgi:hypothetical protein
MLNRPRTEATHAESENQNFMFYVDSGSFGDLNGGSSFVIPGGTVVSTVPYDGVIMTPGIVEQPVISYTTTEAVECQPAQSFAYVPIRAKIEGTGSSVSRNVINQHDFSGYLVSSQGALKCTNRFAIDSGEDRETDGSYRYRLMQVFESKEQAVLASLRLAALSVPGVSDITSVLCEQGPGSFSFYIKSVTPTTSPELISAVSIAVEQVVGYGIRPFVLSPKKIGLEFVIYVSWRANVKPEQKAKEYASMRDTLERELNRTDIGEEVEMEELIVLLLSAAPSALSIGREKANSFEEVFAYRSAPDGIGVIRSILPGDVVKPLYNERVILETDTQYRGVQFL